MTSTLPINIPNTNEMGNNPAYPLDTILNTSPYDVEERKCRKIVERAIKLSIIFATDIFSYSWDRNDFDDVLKLGGVLCFLSVYDVNQIIRYEVNKRITKLGISDLCDRNGYSFVNDYYV